MVAATARKKRKTLPNSINRVSRKSTFMNSPSPTLSDNTPKGRHRNGEPLLLRRSQQHLVSRLSPRCQEVSPYGQLELQMQAQAWHDYRSPVPVVAGIVDVLQAKRRINSPPHVECVVGLDDILAAVIETPIAEKKTGAAEREVFLVVTRDAVRNKYQTGAVELSMPRLAVCARADLRCLVHFSIRIGFMPALVPSPSANHAHPVVDLLFEIHAETVLDCCPERVCGNIRLGRYPGEEIVDRLAVTSHVGVIHKT